MNRYKLMAVISLVLLLGSCVSSLPAPKLAQIRGKLVDSATGLPIGNANLRLWKVTEMKNGREISSEKYPTSEARTDKAGVFLFTSIPPQRYVLSGSYEEESEEFPLRLMEYIGPEQRPAIDVSTGQDIDLGIIRNCRHTVCGP